MAFDSYIARAFGTESGNNPTAQNPFSSALGLGQFTDGTWQGLMDRYPELGLTPDGRTDPAQAKAAMNAFTADNASVLNSNGYQPTDNNLYALHRFGASGGIKLLGSDPNAPIESVVSPDVLSVNPDLPGKTIGQVLNRWSDGNAGARLGGVADVQSRDPAALPANSAPTSDVNANGSGFQVPGGDDDQSLARVMANLGASKFGKLTNNLGDIGIGLMALSNPQAAAVMQSQMKDTRQTSLMQQMQQATFAALSKQMPPAEAAAAALNPEIMKAVAAKRFGQQWQWVDGGTDPLTGQKSGYWVNPMTQQVKAGSAVPSGMATPAPAGPVPPPTGNAGPLGQGGGAPATAAPPATPAPTGGPLNAPAPSGVAYPQAITPEMMQGAQFSLANLNAAAARGATPEQLRAMLPPLYRNMVDGVIRGDMGGAALSRSGNFRNSLMSLASLIDPNFTPQKAEARQQVYKDFMSTDYGKLGGQRVSASMLMHHLNDAWDAIDGLDNTSLPWLNAAGNYVGRNIGDKATQEGLRNFEQKREMLVNELPRYLRGAGVAESDIERQIGLLHSSDSPAELKSTIRGYMDSISGRMKPIVDQYNKAFDTNFTGEQFLTPDGQEALKQLRNKFDADRAGQARPAATRPPLSSFAR